MNISIVKSVVQFIFILYIYLIILVYLWDIAQTFLKEVLMKLQIFSFFNRVESILNSFIVNLCLLY